LRQVFGLELSRLTPQDRQRMPKNAIPPTSSETTVPTSHLWNYSSGCGGGRF
jgi:hypothetical protein